MRKETQWGLLATTGVSIVWPIVVAKIIYEIIHDNVGPNKRMEKTKKSGV
jgi:hypothetical protein